MIWLSGPSFVLNIYLQLTTLQLLDLEITSKIFWQINYFNSLVQAAPYWALSKWDTTSVYISGFRLMFVIFTDLSPTTLVTLVISYILPVKVIKSELYFILFYFSFLFFIFIFIYFLVLNLGLRFSITS